MSGEILREKQKNYSFKVKLQRMLWMKAYIPSAKKSRKTAIWTTLIVNGGGFMRLLRK
jgi:hypothetical protein